MSNYGSQPDAIVGSEGRLARIEAIIDKFFAGGRLILTPDNVRGKSSKSGTGTIANATTSVNVAHGLATTPTIDQIFVTPSNNPTNAPGHMWIDNIDATNFRVNCTNNPGASGLNFGWRVITV